MAQIEFFDEVLGIKLNVKDIYGLIPQDALLCMAFSPYITHNRHGYCRRLKDSIEVNGRQPCLTHFMDKVYPKCLVSDKPFAGKCHAGVYEYIVPVWCEGRLIFILVAGSFRKPGTPSGRRATERLIRRYALSDLDASELRAAYETLSEMPDMAPEMLARGFVYISEAVKAAYLRIRKKRGPLLLPEPKYPSGSAVMDRVIDYIFTHYREKLTLSQLAAAAKCSESYISHNFKQCTGMSTVDFIHAVRIRAAFKLMNETDYSLTRIAFMCGFESSGYFSKVFRRITGFAPLKLRQPAKYGGPEPPSTEKE